MTPIQALDFFGKICDERITLARQSGQGLTADVLLAHAQEAAKVLGPVAQKASEPSPADPPKATSDDRA